MIFEDSLNLQIPQAGQLRLQPSADFQIAND